MSILTATAAELGWAIEAGKTDPLAITEAYLKQIDDSPLADLIYVHVSRERALNEAEAALKRAKSAMRKSPLDGVPVSWKDLFDTADIPTEGGTDLLKGRVPKTDCELIKRATNSGMVCLGKTHLTEFAFSGLGINPVTKTPPNRYHEGRAPGGSSSGAAASIAFDMAPIAIGSDTGGSVRIPAAWNGLVGLKTTHGLLPVDGVLALCRKFDTAGPLCRSVEDAGLMLEVLSGRKINLGNSPDPRALKFLVCTGEMLSGCAPEQLAAFEAALVKLQQVGVLIDRQTVIEFDDIAALGPIMFPYEAYREWGAAIEQAPEKMFEPVMERFMSGRAITDQQNAEAHVKMMKLRAAYQARVADYDGVLMPTTPVSAPEVEPLLGDYPAFCEINLRALSNTRYANMLGLCALTLPTVVEGAGLMLMQSANQEETLLQIGMAIEPVIAC